MSSDEKDLEIARLKGQVEAYQEQLRSLAIELLRKQVKEMQDNEERRDSVMLANQAAFGRLQASFGQLQAKVTERLDKASDKFVEIRDQVRLHGNGIVEIRNQVSDLRSNGPNDETNGAE